MGEYLNTVNEAFKNCESRMFKNVCIRILSILAKVKITIFIVDKRRSQMRLILRLIALTVCCIAFPSVLLSQIVFDETFDQEKSYDKRLDNRHLNFVGFNTLGIVMGEYALHYERVLRPQFSIGGGIGLMTNWGIDYFTVAPFDFYDFDENRAMPNFHEQIFGTPGSVFYLSARYRGASLSKSRDVMSFDYVLMLRSRQFSGNPYIDSSLALHLGYDVRWHTANDFFLSVMPGFGWIWFDIPSGSPLDVTQSLTYILQLSVGRGF